jgi:serine protease Do
MRQLLCISILLGTAISGQAQDLGWIGVRVEDARDRGVVVRRVEPNSPAAKAGLKEGDLIIQFNNEALAGVVQFTRLVRETPPGRTIELSIQRENSSQMLQVTVEKLPFFSGLPGLDLQLPRIRAGDFPQVQVNTTFVQSGIRVQGLTDQLRDFFGVVANAGVLVTSVDSGSAADKAGLKAGDVIVSVDGKAIRSPADFSREMRATGSKTSLAVMRAKQEQEISIEGK